MMTKKTKRRPRATGLPRQCPEGHRMIGRNIVWGSSRGHQFRRCRTCRNDFHRKLEVAKRDAKYADAIGVLENLSKYPHKFPKSMVTAALALLEELHVRLVPSVDFSHAVRNPYAKRLKRKTGNES